MTATSDADADGAQTPSAARRQCPVPGEQEGGRRAAVAAVSIGAPGPPDTVLDSGAIGGLQVRAASVRGLSRRRAGMPRQDSYAVCGAPGGDWLVAVVADGASAGELSHLAAEIVARQGARRVAELLAGQGPQELDWDQVFHEMAEAVRAGGRDELHRHDSPEADPAGLMSATATFVVCATGHDGTHREVTVAWLGDSPVWAVTEESGWVALCAGNAEPETAAVCLPALPRPGDLPVRQLSVDPAAVVLVMTDGVGDPIGDASGEVAATLARWWRTPPDLLTFAEQVALGGKDFDGDRTVVGLWPA